MSVEVCGDECGGVWRCVTTCTMSVEVCGDECGGVWR